MWGATRLPAQDWLGTGVACYQSAGPKLARHRCGVSPGCWPVTTYAGPWSLRLFPCFAVSLTVAGSTSCHQVFFILHIFKKLMYYVCVCVCVCVKYPPPPHFFIILSLQKSMTKLLISLYSFVSVLICEYYSVFLFSTISFTDV